jgi:hypothetical protein
MNQETYKHIKGEILDLLDDGAADHYYLYENIHYDDVVIDRVLSMMVRQGVIVVERNGQGDVDFRRVS